MSQKVCMAETEKVMILNEDNQIEIKTLKYFADLVESPELAEKVLKNIKIFGKTKWTTIKAIHTRKLWENERLFKLKTMSATVILTGDQKIPVIRSNNELILRTSEMRAGDTVLLLAPLGLKDHLKGEDLKRHTLRQGIMAFEPALNYYSKLVGIETDEGFYSVNDVVFAQNV